MINNDLAEVCFFDASINSQNTLTLACIFPFLPNKDTSNAKHVGKEK